MPRILADLPDEDVRWLDALAAHHGRSRAAMIREAVAAYREASRETGIERYFGIWRDRPGETGE
jgi:predicted transcriptional regulator